MITSEIIINKMSVNTKHNNSLEFNEKEVHDTIDDVFNKISGNGIGVKKTWWYYIKQFMCCWYL